MVLSTGIEVFMAKADDEMSKLNIEETIHPDDMDKEIIRFLKQNARMSYTDIGEKIGISRVAVMKRIKRLEDEGIISGYKAVIHQEGIVKMFMEIYTVDDDAEDILEYLNRTGYITDMYRMTGTNHYQATAEAPEVAELKYLTKMFQKKFADKLRKLECHAVKEIIKDTFGGVDYDRAGQERYQRNE